MLALLFACERRPPTPVVWAWEGEQDLTFLRPGEADVAFLAGTVWLEAAGPRAEPRRGALRWPRGDEGGRSRRIAVVRVVTDWRAPPGFDDAFARRLARAVQGLLPQGVKNVEEVQLDFDATASQRTLYAALLRDLRAELPVGTRVSITALASWCLGDPWITALPIDYAVPMYYRMGPDAAAVRAALARGEGPSLALCRGDAGLSADEPMPRLRPGSRWWFFPRGAWTRGQFEVFLAGARQAEGGESAL